MGASAATFFTWLDRGWPHWLIGLLLIAGAARMVLGPRVRVFAFCAGAISLVIALFAFLFIFPVFDDLRHRQQFDSNILGQNTEGTDIMWPPRLCMVDDLLKRHDLHGWKQSKIVDLLGEPDLTNGDGEGQLVYLLGPERGLFRIDSEWLVISLDSDGRVTNYRLAND